MKRPCPHIKGRQHGLASLFHIGGHGFIHIIIGGCALVEHIHNAAGGDMAGGKQHLALGIAHAVIGGHFAGNILLQQIGLLRLIGKKGTKLCFAHDLVGAVCPHAVVGLGHHGIPHLGRKAHGAGQCGHLCAAGRDHPGLGKIFFHGQLALKAADFLFFQAGGYIKIGAQGGIKLQPVFVVAFDPIHFAVAPGKISHAPQHLIVILQAVHPVILGEHLFQFRGKAFIRGIAEAQHIHAVFFEMHAKPAKAFGEVGRNKYKIHGSLHPFLYTSSGEGQGAAPTGRTKQGRKPCGKRPRQRFFPAAPRFALFAFIIVFFRRIASLARPGTKDFFALSCSFTGSVIPLK